MRKLIPVSAVVMGFFVVFVLATICSTSRNPSIVSPRTRVRAASVRRHKFSTPLPESAQHAARYDERMTDQTVLVVDDEEAIAEAVRARLESEGFHGPRRGRRTAGDPAPREHHPDLVVLDLMLPGMDGLEVCKEIQRTSWTPVLMLTAKTEETDKVAGFAVGADDYLTKPFSLRELAARVKAILRRMERMRDRRVGGSDRRTTASRSTRAAGASPWTAARSG